MNKPSNEAPVYQVDTPCYQGLQELSLRAAVSKLLPMRFLYKKPSRARAAREGRLHIEIISHCWRYSHLHAYQLSSLVQHPPQDVDVTMTVYYADEDQATVQLLDYFATKKASHVVWNWQRLAAPELFRRAIGRNKSALTTTADWVWFADCDLIFGAGCLDGLAASLQGCSGMLYFPAEERITTLLSEDCPTLQAAREPKIVQVDECDFKVRKLERAVGAYQIVHGDVCREIGYCNDVSAYQRPTDRWKKTFEDRAYRWIMGTHGDTVEVPSVYRIRHIEKGRYHGHKTLTSIRKGIRQRHDSNKSED